MILRSIYRRLSRQSKLSSDRYDNHQQRVVFVEQLMRKVSALPGVASAGVTTNIPLQTSSVDSTYTVEGREHVDRTSAPITAHRRVGSGYLETLGVRLISGRLLDDRDHADSVPVVVITEEFARQAFAGQDPLGRRLRRGRADQTGNPWLTVVGVVADVKEDRFNFRVARPAWYVPYAQGHGRRGTEDLPLNLLVRASGEATTIINAVQSAVRSVDPTQPISGVTNMKEHLAELLVTDRFGAVLMSTLAALAVVLAAIGIYGVMSYSVSQRTAEIALRMAVGARPSDVTKLIIRQALTTAVPGLFIGVLGAMGLTQILSSTFYQVNPRDPITFTLVALLLGVVAASACYLPARKASKTDPMIVLRR